jgi:hypothetical protein
MLFIFDVCAKISPTDPRGVTVGQKWGFDFFRKKKYFQKLIPTAKG